MQRKVMLLGSPVLTRHAIAVRDFGSARLRALVADMWDTMAAEGGIGIAAPQIGESVRVICFGADPCRHPGAAEVPRTALVNPTVELLAETRDDWADDWEGCLSLPGMRGVVPRARRIRYRGFTIEGEPVEREAEGLHARVVQHEVDHLDGIVYPMRVRDWTRFGFSEALSPKRPEGGG